MISKSQTKRLTFQKGWRCDKHPEYYGNAYPRAGCEKCWEIYKKIGELMEKGILDE